MSRVKISSFEEVLTDVLLNPVKYLGESQQLPVTEPVKLNIIGLLDANRDEIVGKYGDSISAVVKVANEAGYFAIPTGRGAENPAITHIKVGPKGSSKPTLHLYI